MLFSVVLDTEDASETEEPNHRIDEPIEIKEQ